MADEARSLKAYKELPEHSKSLVGMLFTHSPLTDLSTPLSSFRVLHKLATQFVSMKPIPLLTRNGQNEEYFDFEDISGKQTVISKQMGLQIAEDVIGLCIYNLANKA